MPRAKGRLTQTQLAKEADTQLRDNARTVLTNFWASVGEGLSRNDPKTMKLVAEMFNYSKAPGGVTIFNQSNTQVNAAAVSEGQRVRRFDAIIHKLEDRDEQRRITGETLLQNSEDAPEEVDIEEADFEDIPEFPRGDPTEAAGAE